MALQIAELPAAPQRNDPGTFSDRFDAWVGHLPTFRTETNAVAAEVETNANAAATNRAAVDAAKASVDTNTQSAATNRAAVDAAKASVDQTVAVVDAARAVAVAASSTAATAAQQAAMAEQGAQDALDAMTADADAGHSHSIGGIAGLQQALDAKAGLSDFNAYVTSNDAAVSGLTTSTAANLAASQRVTFATGAMTATAGQDIAADVSGGAWTLTLPDSPATGDCIAVAVIDGDPISNPLTVSRSGVTVDGDVSLVMDRANITVKLAFDGTEWRLV